MIEERRAGNAELIELLRELRVEIKEDIKEIKEDLKNIDKREFLCQANIKVQITKEIQEALDANNKLYFNGFDPHEHVADHHTMKSGKKSISSVLDEILKVAAVAVVTFIAVHTWNGVKEEVKSPPVAGEVKK